MHRLVLIAALAAAFPVKAQKDFDFFRAGIPEDRVPGLALIKLKGLEPQQLISSKQGQSPLKALSARSGIDVTLVRPVALGWALVEVRDRGSDVIPDEARTLELVEALARDPAVAAATDDKWMRALRTTNDPGLGQMWHFDLIGAQRAWDVTQGLSSQRIGIIDTGLVRIHEDVGSRAVAGFDFVSSVNAANDGNGRDADFNDAGDNCGSGNSFHGTHVAGTIGATANNGVGVVGLNWNAGLVIARALGKCGGDLVDIGEAAVWLAGGNVQNVPAIGANKVSVMNLSLGSTSSCSSFEQDVVNFVNGQGVIFVAAAGNSSTASQIAPVGAPANCTGVVTVAAHGPGTNRARAPYSSFGNSVEIVAPGGDFSFGNSFGVLSSIGPNADFYTFQQGTSMAAPHVTGAISLMQALNPSLTRQEIVTLMTNNGASCNGCSGKPALVLDATLRAVTPTSPPPPPPPAAQDDPLEENDSFDTAKGGIACGDTRSDLVALPADQDWFLLPTQRGQQIDIVLTTPNGADLDLYVLTGPTANDVVASSESTSGNESVHIDADGQTFRVLVNPYVDTNTGTQNTGSYSLSITCSGGSTTTPPPPSPNPEDPPAEEPPVGPDPGAAEDELEDNDEPSQAKAMFCDEQRTLTARDDDFFIVEVRDGDVLRAALEDNGLGLRLALLDVSGTEVIGQADAGVAASDPLAAGRYLVRVRPSGTYGTYRLSIHCDAVHGANPSVRGGCSSSGGVAWPAALMCLVWMARRRAARLF